MLSSLLMVSAVSSLCAAFRMCAWFNFCLFLNPTFFFLTFQVSVTSPFEAHSTSFCPMSVLSSYFIKVLLCSICGYHVLCLIAVLNSLSFSVYWIELSFAVCVSVHVAFLPFMTLTEVLMMFYDCSSDDEVVPLGLGIYKRYMKFIFLN